MTDMIRTHLNRALVVSAALLLATTVSAAEPSNPVAKAATDKDNKGADKKAEKALDKATDKAADKAADGKGGDKAKVDRSEERAARKLAQHNAQKEKLRGMLKAPMDSAMKQELRRHAERVAKIERVKQVATDAKDNDSVERATKLLAKENARHDKWMEKIAVVAPTPGTPAAPAVDPKADPTKAGAK
jgi:hypothetical protein